MSEAPPRPTPAETEILGVLWDRGPSTVRAVLGALERDREIGYTTVLKLLQIMAGKGLVLRNETDRTHVYRAAVRRDVVQGELVGDLIDRAFDGSAAELVMRALSNGRSTPQELERIRELVDELTRARGRRVR
jgi:BlaI family transcriptional regulator, penicillinase repressor